MVKFNFLYCSIFASLLNVIPCQGGRKFTITNDMRRNSRALIFPGSSAYGILIAIAMPLELDENVFFSYNFEANYNLPQKSTEIFPGILERLDLTEEDGRDLKCSLTNNTCSTEESTTKKTKKRKNRKRPKRETIIDQIDRVFNRRIFYKALIAKLNFNGYNGKACLLRLICEFNEHSIHLYNGVYGSIMHVLFSPLTSKKENIHAAYYQAENDGIEKSCSKYYKRCKQSILEDITKEYEINFDDFL